MNLLLGRFLPPLAVVLLLALLVTTAGWRITAGRADTLKGERDAARAEIVQLKAAVTGKDETITTMQAALAAWQKLATPAAGMAQAAERVTEAAERIDARARALNAAEERDRAKPDCAALLAMDLAAACPATAAGLRERARSGVRRPAGAGASAGGAEGR